MSKLKTRRAEHRKFADEQRERKRQRTINRAALEARGIDTSPKQHRHLHAVKTTELVTPTPEQLKQLKRDELAERAKQFGMTVKSKTTKAQMIEHIMEAVA